MSNETSPRRRPTPLNRESVFSLNELFFSTTDVKGFITFGNDVFVRVSHYDREHLIGAPHRIIRHPDMPRVVFQLLWETIQAGQGISAYVKNMAADGSYYWVLAIVTPVDGGYLSVRLKPTSELFAPIAGLYATLVQIEQKIEEETGSRQQAMAASRVALTQTLNTLGFADYNTFQQAAVLNEVCVRRAKMERKPVQLDGVAGTTCMSLNKCVEGMFSQLQSLAQLQSELAANTGTIRQLASVLQRLSLNAHIRAMHLNEDGTTLEVVADHMNRSAVSLGICSASLIDSMSKADRSLNSARSDIATGDVNVEMMVIFLEELKNTSGSAGQDQSALRLHIGQLAQVVASRLADVSTAARSVTKEIANLNRQLDEFRKHVRTLEILHVTGRTEATRAPNGEHVSMIFDEVHSLTKQARERLDGLIELLEKLNFTPPNMGQITLDLSNLSAAA